MGLVYMTQVKIRCLQLRADMTDTPAVMEDSSLSIDWEFED